jgi:hypothetical protein
MTPEETLRKLLWLRHGCPIPSLYGDDGEMQCSECGIDFKRDDPDLIEHKWTEQNLKNIKVDDPKILDIASIIKKKSDSEYMAKINKMIEHLRKPPE